VLLLSLAGVASFTSATAAQGVDPTAPNPLAGIPFYVDHSSPSWRAWQMASGEEKDLLWKIAREPKHLWFGAFTRPASQFRAKVRSPIKAARSQGALPLLTVMRAVSTGCGRNYQAGGPREDRSTRRWYRRFARAVGRSRVVIAFEPDSLGTIKCHARSRRDDRYRLLRYGVTRLAKNRNATIYIEGGASDWQKPRTTARQLRKVGVAKVRGFMLNATHYDWTAANIRHGLKISRLLGGKHFVINTAENGRGPLPRPKGQRGNNVWCDPPGRGLGPPPTTSTSNPMVDAYLWINRPGYGQSCAGQKIAWRLERALRYARLATTWDSPPG
jgi:endoglucanase